LNRKILQVAEPQFVNARGSAWIAAIALGYLKIEDIPSLVRIKKTYLPLFEDRDLHSQSFREFQAIYKSNKEIYQRLNNYH
jgi:xylulokinase